MEYDPGEPRAIVRERVFGRMRSASADGRHSLLAVALAVFVFVGTGALGFWHATRPARTLDQLERGVSEITDVDTYVAATLPELKETAATSGQPAIDLPGYPLPVVVTADEVRGSSPEQFRDLVLERSAALVYAEGLPAFDRTGNQSISFLSSEWFLDRALNLVRGDWHDRARWIAIVSAIGAGLAAALLFARRPAAAGLQSVGLAVAAGAIPGLVFSAAGAYWFGRTGGDPFSSAVGSILEAFFLVPRRDFLVATTLGAFFAAVGYLLPIIDHFVARRPAPAHEAMALSEPNTREHRQVPAAHTPDGDRDAEPGSTSAATADDAAEVNG